MYLAVSQAYSNIAFLIDIPQEKSDLRQEIGEVIDQSTQAYDSRDEAQAKMILLKEKADKDMAQHQQEMKELQRIIDHDKKLREFMNIKGKEREEDDYLKAWRQKKGQCLIYLLHQGISKVALINLQGVVSQRS